SAGRSVTSRPEGTNWELHSERSESASVTRFGPIDRRIRQRLRCRESFPTGDALPSMRLSSPARGPLPVRAAPHPAPRQSVAALADLAALRHPLTDKSLDRL